MYLYDAIEKLLHASAAAGLSEATIVSYQKHLVPLKGFFGNVEVETLSTDDLRAYVRHLQTQKQQFVGHRYRQTVQKPLSRHTVNAHLRACRRLFNFLHQEYGLEENPAARIRIARPRHREIKALSNDALQAMLAVTEGQQDALNLRDRAVLLCLADTGCRRGGLAGLTRGQLSLVEQHAQVMEKGGRARRIFFGRETALALQAWLAVRPECGYDELFVTLTPGRINPLGAEGISRICKRVKKLAQVVGPASPHAFRHRFAREFLRKGGDIGVLAQLMGHTDISVTLAHYAQFVPDELQVFHRRFSSLSDLLPGEEALADRACGAKDGGGAEALADRAGGAAEGVGGEGSAPDKAGKHA